MLDGEMPEGGVEVRTYFARQKNALVARADFSPLFAALILHEVDHGLETTPAFRTLLRETLSAAVLVGATRPTGESFAWTLGFPEPRANVFSAVSNPERTVAGTVFCEDLKALEEGRFYEQTAAPGRENRLSATAFAGSDPFGAAEAYARQSEGRAARFFRYAEEDFVLVAAQPDCDLPWIEGLDDAAVRALDSTVELSLLECRVYRFACGCTHARMMDVLLTAMREDPGSLFGESETLTMRCPRCGARHLITRETMEAHLATATKKRN